MSFTEYSLNISHCVVSVLLERLGAENARTKVVLPVKEWFYECMDMQIEGHVIEICPRPAHLSNVYNVNVSE